VLEFEEPSIETLQNQVALRHEFRVIRHRLELYGYCRKCETKLTGKAGRWEIEEVENASSNLVDASEEL
jgi:Fur family ferric uptake transcriptional regulator